MLWERWSRLKATQRKDNRGESVESVPPAPSGSGRRPACPCVCRCVDAAFAFVHLCLLLCATRCVSLTGHLQRRVELAGQFDVRFASAAFDRFLSHRPADLSSQGSPPFSIKQDDYFHDWLSADYFQNQLINRSVSQSPTRRRLLIQQTKNQILVTIIGLPNNQWFIFLWLIHLLIVAALL